MVSGISVKPGSFQRTWVCIMSFEPYHILNEILPLKAGVCNAHFFGDGTEIQRVSKLSRAPMCVMSCAGWSSSELANLLCVQVLEQEGLPSYG